MWSLEVIIVAAVESKIYRMGWASRPDTQDTAPLGCGQKAVRLAEFPIAQGKSGFCPIWASTDGMRSTHIMKHNVLF